MYAISPISSRTFFAIGKANFASFIQRRTARATGSINAEK